MTKNLVDKIAQVLVEKPAVRRRLVDALEDVYRSVGEPVLSAGAVMDALRQATALSKDNGGADGSTEAALYDHSGWAL